MKALKLFFLLLFLPIINYAQNCSANPGGDRAICNGDLMILYGEDSEYYLHPLDIEWSVVYSPIDVEFDNPHILQPTVSPANPDEEFVNDDYIFQLRVICIDLDTAYATVTVTVGEIFNPATILPPYDVNSDVCGSTITIQGSEPDNGVTNLWLINPDLNVTIIPSPDGTSLQVIRDNGAVNCDYTIYYYQNIGSCESIDSTQIHFTQEYSSVHIDYVDPDDCPSCSRRIRVCGTIPGCDGTPVWGTVNPPANVTIETPDKRCTWITVDADGVYTFSYTIDNGSCNTDTVTSTCVIEEQEGFPLGGDSVYVSCQDTWDIASMDLSVDYMEGVEYEWEGFSSIGSSWITFSDQFSSSTTVFFAGTPVSAGNGLWIRIEVTAIYNGCKDLKRFYYYINPTVSVESENINLLCGGDPFFMIRDYINTGSGGGSLKAKVLDSPSPLVPIGSTFFIYSNTHLDLSEPGTYSFEITISRTGNDPTTGLSVTCTDKDTLNVFVANIPTINAGSDILTCLLITQLNGNEPLDENGHPVDIPVQWELLSGQTGVQITNPDDQDPVITGLQYGETYCFEYSFSKAEDCKLVDTMYLTVKPEEECEICELSVEVGPCIEGCLSATVQGAETYLWVPADGIDDPTSANPTFCNTTGTYAVYGFIGQEACGFAQIDIPPCEAPVECDGFYVKSSCGTCSCGNPVLHLNLYDSNDNLADEDVIDITWTVYGNNSNANPYSTYYTGIAVYSVHITYTTLSGEVCDTTITGAQACAGDCFTYSVASCADEPFQSEYEECTEYTNICNGAGYIFILDDSGNPVPSGSHVFEINGQNHTENPIFLSLGWDFGGCGPIPIRIWNWWSECDTTIMYTPDCCSTEAPNVECAYGGETPSLQWFELCGAEYYEVESMCLNGWGYSFDYIYTPNETGYYSFTPDFSSGCNLWVTRVRGYCASTGMFGPYSDCFMIDNQGNCFPTDCSFWFPEYDGGGGEGGGRQAALEMLGYHTSSLYPNPAGDEEVYLNLSNSLSSNQGRVELRIQDVDGKLIRQEWLSTENTTHVISVDGLSSGLYLFSIYSEEGVFLESNRLVKSGRN